MKVLPFKLGCLVTAFCLLTGLSSAQDWETEGTNSDPFGGDPFGGLSGDTTSSSDWGATDSESQSQEQGSTSSSNENDFSGSQNSNATENTNSNQSGDIESQSPTQDAIIEGVQLSTEKGLTDDEKIVSGYFIFRDKPTSYFYETKLREKKMIFEFKDARVGASPVPSVSESPIKGFTIEQGKEDVNKAVRGLKPEWHNSIRVIFDLEAVPEVHVNDEYSIVSFSFKWSSDPAKVSKYTVKDPRVKIPILAGSGIAGLGLGATIIYFATRPPQPVPLEPLTTKDLPEHQKIE